MDLTFVLHFTARPVPINVLLGHFSLWEDYTKQLSDVNFIDTARKFVVSDGDLSEPSIEIIGDDKEYPDIWALGFEGTLLLSGERVVKTRMVTRLGKTEYQGEIYITLMNFPPQKTVEKDYFFIGSLFQKTIFKDSTPFQWTPAPAPKILQQESQLRWIIAVIKKNEKYWYFDYARVTVNSAVTDTTAVAGTTNTVTKIQSSDSTNVENPAEDTIEVPAETPTETTTDSATDATAKNPGNLAAEIARLKDQLEEYKSENEELSEKIEQLTSEKREHKKDKLQFAKTIEEQKERIRNLKKRVKNAEKIAKENVNGDVTEFCEFFDKELEKHKADNQKLSEQVQNLTSQLSVAEGKIQTLKGRLNKGNSAGEISGLLAAPQSETEKYENEFGIALFSALHKAIEKTPQKSNSPRIRSIDMWQAIIDANPELEKAYEEYCDNKDALKNAVVSGELSKKKQLLKPFNLTFDTHTNCHGKITFENDQRYIASTASTASETISGFSNCAKDMRNTFLYPT